MHHGAVIVGVGPLKTPYARRKYSWDELYISDPWVVEHLRSVVKDKTAGEGVEISRERNGCYYCHMTQQDAGLLFIVQAGAEGPQSVHDGV